jgi:hypothetical protein
MSPLPIRPQPRRPRRFRRNVKIEFAKEPCEGNARVALNGDLGPRSRIAVLVTKYKPMGFDLAPRRYHRIPGTAGRLQQVQMVLVEGVIIDPPFATKPASPVTDDPAVVAPDQAAARAPQCAVWRVRPKIFYLVLPSKTLLRARARSATGAVFMNRKGRTARQTSRNAILIAPPGRPTKASHRPHFFFGFAPGSNGFRKRIVSANVASFAVQLDLTVPTLARLHEPNASVARFIVGPQSRIESSARARHDYLIQKKDQL